MHGRSLHGNREISRSDRWRAALGWSASGRRGAEADDARTGEVGLRHSSDEAGEQGRATGCGVGGAKGGDQGEHGRATHAPDAEPGKRVPGAGPCTASSKARKKERFTALLHHVTVDLLREAYFALKRDAAPGVDGVTWQEYEAGPGGQPRWICMHAFIAARIGRCRRGGSTSRNRMGGSARWGSLRWKTRSSSGRWWRCSMRSTRRTSSGSRTGSGPGAASTMRWMRCAVGDLRYEGELDSGRRHSRLLRHGQPRMAGPFRGASDRRPARDPPDPQMAEGGRDGRREW